MPPRLTQLAAGTAGHVLAAGLGGVAALRRGKPLHPRGEISRAVLEVTTPVAGTGPFVGSAATYDGLARHATAMGLPSPWPDIDGLALRLPVEGSDADLLFAATGTGRWTRHVLVPHRSGAPVPMTTLFPFETDAGRLVLGVFPDGDRFDLRVSVGSGPWRPLGRLTLEPLLVEDPPELRFDPVRNAPPGLGTSATLVALRDPAYVAARRTS
ncbi:hypothetical protein [Nocardioides sp. P5_C9_2]